MHLRPVLLTSILLLLTLAGVALSADFACFDSARPLGSQFQYVASVDPSQVTSPLCGPPIPAAQTEAQRALVAQTPTHAGHQCPVMSCYLKVEAGLAVEMTTAEKQAVDDKLAADAAYRAQFSEELQTQDYCNTLTLTDVDTKIATIKTNIHADIDGAATTAEKIEAVKRSFDKVLTALQKLSRCQISAFRLRGGAPGG